MAVGTGSSSAVWSTLIPIPITTIGGRVWTRSTRIPHTLRSPIITSLGHFRVAKPPRALATAYPATSGTTGHHSASTTGSKTAENVSAAPRGVTHSTVEPSTALLLVVGDDDPMAHRVGSSQCVGRAGLGVQAHLPLRAGHRLEGDLVERRPSEGGGVHGTRLAWQTRGGHT